MKRRVGRQAAFTESPFVVKGGSEASDPNKVSELHRELGISVQGWYAGISRYRDRV
ncbi:hypothetical protein [Paenibacillus sp. FSL H7-0756]|uniref:hypothetical protein n=1 Tax=Paenibacillus sp. FSL H7-0756 TaxID=2954738 RepID=UPI004046D743